MKPYVHAEDIRFQVKWSASELKWLREEQEGGFSISLLFPSQDGGNEVAVRRGTAYYRLSKRANFTWSWTEEGLWDFLRELVETDALPEEDGTLIALSPVIRSLQSTFTARFAGVRRAGTLYRETPFVMVIPAREADPSKQSEEPVVVQGVIDAWPEEAGQLVVPDYETDKVVEEAHHREKYTVRLSLYMWAPATAEEKIVVEKSIYSTARGEAFAL